MQQRMKEHPLSKEKICALLEKEQVGQLAMVEKDGAPYGIPVHYVYDGTDVYFHGLPKGEKIDNIKRDPRVCFQVHKMMGLLIDEEEVVCDTNTAYESVILRGTAKIVSDIEKKREILEKVVSKYTPQFSGRELPENMVKGTAVIKIKVQRVTGKYFK